MHFHLFHTNSYTILSMGGENLYHIEHFLGKNKIHQEIKMIVPRQSAYLWCTTYF